MSTKISSKDSKIYLFTSENKEESTSSSAVQSLFPSSERMILSEVRSKEGTEVASHMVAATATMVATEETSHMVTEEDTVATNHMEVAEGTKVATKGATNLATEVMARAVNPMIEPSLLATLASIARSLMLAMSLEEKDLTLSELECSKIKTESLREPPSLNLTRRKTLIEHAG